MSDLRSFLEEDAGSGDITSDIFVPKGDGIAEMICEDDAVVSGLREAAEIFEIVGVKFEPLVKDGGRVKPGTKVADITGPNRGILTGERTALNIMMRMSGISTMTNNILEECRKVNKNIIIAGTRKTTPGFREFEKRAISLGGGWTHRYGLYDAVLIKDNHIQAAGGVANAMELAKNVPSGMTVEIEIENIDDAEIAAKYGPDIIMIDNQSHEEIGKIYRRIKEIDPKIKVEVSGRITAETAKDYAKDCDIISIGALTHSVKAVHFSLRMK